MKSRLYSLVAITVAAIFFAMMIGPTRTLSHRAPIKPVSGLTGSALLDDWGNRFTFLGTAVGENALRTQVRTTIAQMAMFDAVNAALNGPYRSFGSTKLPSAPGASPEAAAISAAYYVALNEFPSATDIIENAYQTSITGVLAGEEARNQGINLGKAAAEGVLDDRKNDNRNLPELDGYTPGSGPGVWIPTSPSSPNPQTPFLQFVTPFGYDEPSRFRPAPPPALDSRTYTMDYNEVKDMGRFSKAHRTEEQSDTAKFWSPSASALWTANIRSRASSMDLLTAARFEAIGIAAVTNALIASWDAKFTYMYWRPITAIRAGDTDGNAETEQEADWTPFITTPSHPEYPAAHTTVGASVLGFYTVWLDTDQFDLEFKGLNNQVRNYTSVNEVHEEEGNARVWGGMHWRNSTVVGTAVGSKVGKYTATHLLKPLGSLP
jgi:hypothetical protein